MQAQNWKSWVLAVSCGDNRSADRSARVWSDISALRVPTRSLTAEWIMMDVVSIRHDQGVCP